MKTNVQKLSKEGITKLSHLLWTFPTKISHAPKSAPFHKISKGKLFKGVGKIIQYQSRPNSFAKNKWGKTFLQTVTIYIRDAHSNNMLTLVWFNCYQNIAQKLRKYQYLEFMGTPRIYKGSLQIANPWHREIQKEELKTASSSAKEELVIQYPTINFVDGNKIKQMIDQIPPQLWNGIGDILPENIIQKRHLIPLRESLKTLHGKSQNWSEKKYQEAKKNIIYREFFYEQTRIFLRRSKTRQSPSINIRVKEEAMAKLKAFLPYQLTKDQNKALEDIRQDIASPGPMMRLLQGRRGPWKNGRCSFGLTHGLCKRIPKCPYVPDGITGLPTLSQYLRPS